MKVSEILKIPGLEKELLLASVFRKDRSFLAAFPETQLTRFQEQKFRELSKRLGAHEPLAYILGYKEFYGRKFLVNKNVLIPRPETEDLVEEVLNYADGQPKKVLDVGTGSGIIALTLKLENPELDVIATDISSEAIEVAKKNAKLHGLEDKVVFKKMDLLSGFKTKVDIIVANLPYIKTADWQRLPQEIKAHEPRVALDSGKSGLALYKQLFEQAKAALNPEGIIFYEVNGEVFRQKF